jgi:hypothetical protein
MIGLETLLDGVAANRKACRRMADSRASRSRFSRLWRPSNASMSHRISAARRPSSEVFFNPFGWGNWVAELQIADLPGNSGQLLDQFPEPAILLHLLLRSVHSRTSGNDPGLRLATHGMGERIGRAMPFRASLGAVASWFSALAEASYQRTGSHLTDLRDPFLQLVALEHEGIDIQVVGHGST